MSTKSKVVSGADTTSQDVADQMATLRADISVLSGLVAELAQNKAADLSDAAKEQLAAAKKSTSNPAELARDQAQLLQNQAQQLQDQATAFTREQPGVAIGIAAGLGFLVGMMMLRK